VEHSQEDEFPSDLSVNMVSTLPAPVKKRLLAQLEPPESRKTLVKSTILPEMDTIPEEFSGPSASDVQQRGGPPASEVQRVGADGQDVEILDDITAPGARVDHDDDAAPVSDDEIEPSDPHFWPTARQIQDLKLAHDNSGHPTNADFARMIRLGNGKPELVRWVKQHFKCDDCLANKVPCAKRPTAVPKTYRFNHVVGLDLVFPKDQDQVRVAILNCLCWGASFQQVKILAGDNEKTAENVWSTFVDTWVRIFGFPDILVVDSGLELI